MSLTIHHLNESRSQRVLWLTEELGRDYRIVHHRRGAAHRAPEALRQLHPLGKAPLVEDDGRVFAETAAIVAHLARGTALMPDPATPEGEAVEFWLHHAEGSAMPPLVTSFVLDASPAMAPRLARPLVRGVTRAINHGYADPDIARLAAFWEGRLAAGSGWFAAGRFTVADVMMSYPVEMAALRGPDGVGAATADWLGRIHARPAYLRAVEKGGAYSGATAGAASIRRK